MKESNKDKGLLNKYIISKTDGSTIDKDAEYFILRLDLQDMHSKENTFHRIACRKAILTYAEEIKDVLPELAKDLINKYE